MSWLKTDQVCSNSLGVLIPGADEVKRIPMQPNLSAIILSWRLSIFGHIACMDDDGHAKMILTAPLQRTVRDHRGVPYHVAEHHPLRSDSLQPHWTKQSTWLRTALCESWCLRTVLRAPHSAYPKRRSWYYWYQMLKAKGKGFPILDTECWARSWSRCTGSQPTGDHKSSIRR